MNLGDTIHWSPTLKVEKFSIDQTAFAEARLSYGQRLNRDWLRRLTGEPEDGVVVVEGNLLLTAGLQRLTRLLTATSAPTALTNTTGRVGVGNGSTAVVVGDTDLSAAAGSSNRWFNILDATYPTQNNGLVTCVSTFASGDGNFAWNEWGIDIGTATVTSGATVNTCLLNRKVTSIGTKGSGVAWVATATITFS